MEPQTTTLEGAMNLRRNQLSTMGEALLKERQDVADGKIILGENCDKGEAIANITLAYRHLEDSIMRLGKVIQADQGGVSIYDKK